VLETREKLRGLKERVDEEYGVEIEDGGPPEWSRIKEGDRVAVMPLGVEAEIIEVPGAEVEDDDEVRVRIGKLTVKVEASKIRALAEKEESPAKALIKPEYKKTGQNEERVSISLAADDSPHLPQMPQTERNTLDLRGKRIHEAEAEIEQFLDRSCREHMPNVFIIHGHGTGALKQMVRELLAESPYVDHFRPGERGEGGDGATVAALKEWGFS
jgi:DNA mismatch repair protein MutS2